MHTPEDAALDAQARAAWRARPAPPPAPDYVETELELKRELAAIARVERRFIPPPSARPKGRWKHPPGCTCMMHDTELRPCPEPGCTVVCKGWRGVAAHRRQSRAHKPTRSPRRVVRAGALGMVTKTAADTRLNLDELNRFAAALAGGRRHTPRLRARTTIDRTIAAANSAPERAFTLAGVEVTGQAAAAILRLAKASGVPPKTIIYALIAYGIEHLAGALRKDKRAPAVRLPDAPVAAQPVGVEAVVLEEERKPVRGGFPGG